MEDKPSVVVHTGFQHEDLSGQTFGRITVHSLSHITQSRNGRYRRFWHCFCACGKKRIVREDYIKGNGVTCKDCRNAEIRTRMGPRTCPKCRRTLPRDEFYSDKTTTDELARYCIDCSRSTSAKRRSLLSRRRPEEIEIPKEKRCNACNLVKPAEDFWTDKTEHDGLCNQCSDCRTAYHRKWYLKWRKKHIRKSRFSRYGLTYEDVMNMLEAQGQKCAICKRQFETEKDWHIDHDHATGAVRGILCKPCNNALGGFRDSVEIMLSAASYIQKSRGIQNVA